MAEKMLAGSFVHLYVYLFALIFGAIGFLDDYQKVKKRQNLGLTAGQKFALQVAAAVVFLGLLLGGSVFLCLKMLEKLSKMIMRVL